MGWRLPDLVLDCRTEPATGALPGLRTDHESQYQDAKSSSCR